MRQVPSVTLPGIMSTTLLDAAVATTSQQGTGLSDGSDDALVSRLRWRHDSNSPSLRQRFRTSDAGWRVLHLGLSIAICKRCSSRGNELGRVSLRYYRWLRDLRVPFGMSCGLQPPVPRPAECRGNQPCELRPGVFLPLHPRKWI